MTGKGKLLLVTAVCALLGIGATACGSSDSTSGATTAGGGEGIAGSGSSPGEGSSGGGSRGARGLNHGPSSGEAAAPAPPGAGGGQRNANGAPLGSDTSKQGDNSIETYGSEVTGAEKAAAVAAMRSFVLAIAANDYATVCEGLAEKVRITLVHGTERCPDVLGLLLQINPAEARRAANGTVTHVRVGGDNAFVLFRPSGGKHLNYFVMTLEGGRWKSLGLSIGTPLEPVLSGP